MIGSIIGELFVNFKNVFTQPSFANFVSLGTGCILCSGRHSISRIIQSSPDAEGRNHSRYYNFFSRAQWRADDLSMQLVSMVLKLIPGKVLLSTVDDTLAHRSGAHIWGAGMHYDALQSNYGRGEKRITSFAFGHSWVVVCLLIPAPWDCNHMLSVPVLFRLYRSKKTCPEKDYRKRSELAADLVELLCRWLPRDYHLHLLGDDEYATKTVASRIGALEDEASRKPNRLFIPEKIVLCGPITMKAALYAPPRPSRGRGRPRKRGERLPSPRELAEKRSIRWKTKMVHIYGRDVAIKTKTLSGMWYESMGNRLVRVVVTRDPKGRIDDRAFFVTEPSWSVEQIIVSYSHRWSQEVMHRNLKQYFGLHDPQNGWWRHPKGKRKNSRRPGPNAHESRGEKAATRTVPFILTVYAVVEIWYLNAGNPQHDVDQARARAPWNKKKRAPSFADRLVAARRGILFPSIFDGTGSTGGSVKIDRDLLEILLSA